MSQRTRKWGDIFGKLFDWFLNNLDDAIPERSSLNSDLVTMNDALDAYADAASFAMALAEQKHADLKKEIKTYDNLVSKAEHFALKGEEVASKRCLFLKRTSAETIATLTKEYKRLQNQAEIKAKDFAAKRNELRIRIEQLPSLENQTRLEAAEKRVDDSRQRLLFEEAKGSFDASAGQIDLARLQAENKTVLLSDPNEALDRAITESLEQDVLEEEYARMRGKVSGGESLSALEPNVSDLVEEAKKLLEAPRYHDFASESMLPSAQVPLRR